MVAQERNSLRRVLYVTDLDPSLKFGSIEEQIFTLAHAFKERGSLFLPLFQAPLGSNAAAAYSAAGLEAEWANLNEFNVETLFRLLAVVRRQKIEIVHWNFYGALNPYFMALVVLKPRLLNYLTDHNSRGLDPRGLPVSQPVGPVRESLKRVLLRRYSKVLCISNFVLQCLKDQRIWSNLSCCAHFVNTDRFHPDPDTRERLRREMNVDEHFVVLIVAQLIRAKGVEVVLKAMRRLSRRSVLWIVGHGEEADSLQRLCTELSLDTRVTFFGWQRDVSPYMQAVDCLVVPSIWGEAAGLVILEGLASALPVIASAVGGIPEFIEDGKTGFLFPAGDDARLAEIIHHLEDNPGARGEVGRSGRAAAVERSSVEARLGAYLELYRRPLPGNDLSGKADA